MKRQQKFNVYIHHTTLLAKSLFWFIMGVFLGLFFVISFSFIIFQKAYGENIYPGIIVDGVNLGGKSKDYIENYFALKNERVQNTTFTITYKENVATISADSLHLGYDGNLIAQQAYTIGRSNYILSNIVLIFQAYTNGLKLSPIYTYDRDKFKMLISPMVQKAHIDPIDALFSFENGRVTAFRLSSDGQDADIDTLEQSILTKLPYVVAVGKSQNIPIALPIKIVKPKITTDSVNSYGIKELIGMGTSLYHYSIDSRKFNIALASSRVNDILVAPNQIFSFDQSLGDVSYLTGYKQAYVIANGKTVLGDGGGVCQVSTTLFRAILSAGLPIAERHAHAYRVEYYEEDSDPGKDATIFYPSVDLKFKNDTGHYILIQSVVDPTAERLTYYLYGTSDGRQTTISNSVITSQTPPPPTLYQDDPTAPKGVLKQTDFAAWGANVYFTRTVTRDGEQIISERYDSHYQPWQAVYLRGTL